MYILGSYMPHAFVKPLGEIWENVYIYIFKAKLILIYLNTNRRMCSYMYVL